MFNLSGSEMVFLLLIALVVLGPEKLPEAVRRFGKAYGEFKKVTTGFQSELRNALDEPMKEMRETADQLRKSANLDFGFEPQRIDGDTGRLAADEPAAVAPADVVVANAAADAVATDAVIADADVADAAANGEESAPAGSPGFTAPWLAAAEPEHAPAEAADESAATPGTPATPAAAPATPSGWQPIAARPSTTLPPGWSAVGTDAPGGRRDGEVTSG